MTARGLRGETSIDNSMLSDLQRTLYDIAMHENSSPWVRRSLLFALYDHGLFRGSIRDVYNLIEMHPNYSTYRDAFYGNEPGPKVEIAGKDIQWKLIPKDVLDKSWALELIYKPLSLTFTTHSSHHKGQLQAKAALIKELKQYLTERNESKETGE